MKLLFAGIVTGIAALIAFSSAIFYAWINETPGHPPENQEQNELLFYLCSFLSLTLFLVSIGLIIYGIKSQNKRDAEKRKDKD